MISIEYAVELLTPCLCHGADPRGAPEIRAPSIRGQLRWWFRVLGGFKTMVGTLREQENAIFGSAAGKEGTASKLMVRVHASQLPVSKITSETGPRYVTFPFVDNERRKDATSAIDAGECFTVRITWRGAKELRQDIHALMSVFIHLGSLGNRSRRGFGALAAARGVDIMSLDEAMKSFKLPGGIAVRKISNDKSSPQQALADWLKGWRSHGRSDSREGLSVGPGVSYARRDHDEGYRALTGTKAFPNQSVIPIGRDGETFRPALGLPIVQSFSNGRGRVDWEGDGKGRFASPVLLRPMRTTVGKTVPAVIFVDGMSWQRGTMVTLKGRGPEKKLAVSMELYERMKKDTEELL